MLQQLGGPTLYRRHVNLLVNGQQRGLVYEDSQQPSGEVIDEWFPDDNHGDLHKIEDWFEFDNTGDNKLFNVDATLEDFTTTGGAKKLARYRWNWRKRAVPRMITRISFRWWTPSMRRDPNPTSRAPTH